MDSEKYRKKYMRICSICEEEKPLEDMATEKVCKQCKCILDQAGALKGVKPCLTLI